MDHTIVELLLRFLLTLAFNAVQMRIVVKHNSDSKTHIFSFVIISIIVFFLSHALRTFDMQLGMAIGMFAVFGIVRYRTESLKTQEMTYLFSAIGIAVINALSGDLMGWAELLTIDGLVLVLIYILERFLVADSPSPTHKKLSINLSIAELQSDHINTHLSALGKDLNIHIIQYTVTKVDYTLGTAQIQVLYERE